jgi:K+-sensing histidine kinase KdpD
MTGPFSAVSAVLSFGNGAPQERTEGGRFSPSSRRPGAPAGILAVCQIRTPLRPARRRLLEAFAIQADMALERIRLSGDARVLNDAAREKMQSGPAQPISQSSHTPLPPSREC